MEDNTNRPSRRPDPTSMANQPALQQSRGTIWIVMGGLFLIASLIPFAALTFAASGRSAPLAATIGVAVVVLYAVLVASRFAVRRQKLRLRVMAACMLTMAATALVGVWVCALIENAPLAG